MRNLDKFSYKQWVRFVFDHPIVAGKREKEWYWDEAWSFTYDDPLKQAQYVTRLFTRPTFLLSNYSDKKIEQGMWFLMCAMGNIGGKSEQYLGSIICSGQLPFSQKRTLIRSIEFLYSRLFKIREIECCTNMFWDLVIDFAFDGTIGIRSPLKPFERSIQNEMFRTLKRILGMEKDYVQKAALHGLNHLQHPKTKSLVEAYIKSHPYLSEHDIAFARRCIKGKIL